MKIGYFKLPASFQQKGGLPTIGLDQVGFAACCGRQYQARQTSAGTKVNDGPRRIGQQRQELQRIQHVALPLGVFGCVGDEVDAGIPLAKKGEVIAESFLSFTWNIDDSA